MYQSVALFLIALAIGCSPPEQKTKEPPKALTAGEHLIAAREILKSNLIYPSREELRKLDDHLSNIKESEPEFKEASKLKVMVEKLKVKLEKEAAEEKRRTGIFLRERYVENFERELLRKG